MKRLFCYFAVVFTVFGISLPISGIFSQLIIPIPACAASCSPKSLKRKVSIYVNKDRIISVKDVKMVISVRSERPQIASVVKRGKKLKITGQRTGNTNIYVKIRTRSNKKKILKYKVKVYPAWDYYTNGEKRFSKNKADGAYIYTASAKKKYYLLVKNHKPYHSGSLSIDTEIALLKKNKEWNDFFINHLYPAQKKFYSDKTFAALYAIRDYAKENKWTYKDNGNTVGDFGELMILKKGACGSFASLFNSLCYYSKVPCVLTVHPTLKHACNALYWNGGAGGEWYYLEPQDWMCVRYYHNGKIYWNRTIDNEYKLKPYKKNPFFRIDYGFPCYKRKIPTKNNLVKHYDVSTWIVPSEKEFLEQQEQE